MFIHSKQMSQRFLLPAGLEGFLKGADAVVLAAANHLKLKAELHPIWQEEDMSPYCDEEDIPPQGEVVGNTFSFVMPDVLAEWFNDVLHENVKAAYAKDDIIWCTPDRRAWAEDHSVATYGNEPSTGTVYSAAAILIHVPAWSARQA